jgi:hypothetical protein
MASLQRRNRAQTGDDISQIGLFPPGIISEGHRRLEHPPVAGNAMGDGAADLLSGRGAGRVEGQAAGKGLLLLAFASRGEWQLPQAMMVLTRKSPRYAADSAIAASKAPTSDRQDTMQNRNIRPPMFDSRCMAREGVAAKLATLAGGKAEPCEIGAAMRHAANLNVNVQACSRFSSAALRVNIAVFDGRAADALVCLDRGGACRGSDRRR